MRSQTTLLVIASLLATFFTYNHFVNLYSSLKSLDFTSLTSAAIPEFSLTQLLSQKVEVEYESQPKQAAELCPLVPYHHSSKYPGNKPLLEKILHSSKFRQASVPKLQGAVQIPTESHDDDPKTIEEDPEYWSKFSKFESYLNKTFPTFYSHPNITLHKVNHHGLVYIWTGSNSTLKPIVLMAHQDVVPVPDTSRHLWEHDPWKADYDGVYMYGRGVSDCKNMLIGEIEAAEELILSGFKPQRTIVFSFGFDEEVGGERNHNAKFLEEVYGKDGVVGIFDEGGVSLLDIGGSQVAIPGTGEKGYLDLKIKLSLKGGHSSTPPKHTAIGLIGKVIVEIEDNEFESYFTEVNPTYWQYVCLAEHSVDLDDALRQDILNSQFDPEANKRVREFIKSDRKTRYGVMTTQALDLIDGGSKTNALPEFVELTINNRVIIEESLEDVKQKYIQDVLKVANKFNIGVNYVSEKGEKEIIKTPEAGDNTFMKS
ncbi:unnamed protein product [Ambrosiozyma monospora]|uniref:Unnamed protein product n=1 Tax=Ambrosiozyma monospora TaxID=43982 RepID=A0A9W6Z513_AMBMO|nr:unnamed protein product [Ambrosiozyma monospora]